jgi:Transposase DDE domain group 1
VRRASSSDAESGPIRLSFNPQLRVEFHRATVTSDAGLLLPREQDERLGLDALIERHRTDPRTGHNRQFPLPDLFRQSIYSRLAGHEDTNDAERLAEDPTFRMLASRERRETSVALTSTLHWFETDVLTEKRNYQGLARLNTALIHHASTRSPNWRVTLDIDSFESPVHGAQEQSAYNGHFESVCHHPRLVFNPKGDCLAAKLRPGNVHSADGWDDVLLPIIDRYLAQGQTVVVRADAAFALPALYEALERRGVRYAIRLPANDVLERRITRPRGRPSHAPLVRFRSFEYQAASWERPRRVIAKIEHHLGELFPRVGFIVTTLTGTNRAVVRFYNQRGTAEQWIKEGKAATHWTRLSCHRFRANEVRLLLGVVAYNLGNLLRRLVLPLAIQSWSLTSLQQRLFKTGGRLIRHARYFILLLAESHLTKALFRQILGRIERLARPHVIEKAGHGAREKRSALGGSVSLGRMVAEGKPWEDGPSGSRRRRDSPCDAFRTAEGGRGVSRGLFNTRKRGLGSKSQIPA